MVIYLFNEEEASVHVLVILSMEVSLILSRDRTVP